MPLLRQTEKSYILNVGSIAAYSPVPFKTIYPASKSFISVFTQGLHEELAGTGINVSLVSPGPFFSNPDASERINNVKKWSKIGVISPENIAKKTITAMLKGKKVIVPGFFTKIAIFIIWLLPKSLSVSIYKRISKRELMNR